MTTERTSGPIPDEDLTHLRSSTSPTVAVEYDAAVLAAAEIRKPPPPSRTTGDLVDGRYRLGTRLGGGGMGVVFRARDKLMEEAHDPDPDVAIKLIGDAIKEHPQAAIALQREAHRSQNLSHHNIVKVFHFGQDAGSYYLTMELLDGRSMEEVVRDRPTGHSWREAGTWIRQLCEALAYAHREGIVHSDIKPSNLFLTENQTLKVLDFGIATPLLNRGAKGRETLFDPRRLGAVSPRYSSVEMWLGMDADPRDDVFSAACVIYEILSGRHPFGKKSAPEALEAGKKYVPIDGLGLRRNRALAHALAFRRDDRTATIETLLAELDLSPGNSKSILTLSLSVALAVIVAFTVWWAWVRGTEDADTLFLRSLVTSSASQSEDYDESLVQTLFELADGYVDAARVSYDAATLSEGVSSAYGSFRNILELDPGNERAAQGILEVFKLHRQEAYRLVDDQQFERAREVIDYAMKINPNSHELQRLKQSLAEKPGAPVPR